MVDKCFGSNGRNGCNILTVRKCQQDKCSFYKSAQDLEEDRKKAYLLLAALPPDMQRYISDKYYNGGCHGQIANVLFNIPDEIFMR